MSITYCGRSVGSIWVGVSVGVPLATIAVSVGAAVSVGERVSVGVTTGWVGTAGEQEQRRRKMKKGKKIRIVRCCGMGGILTDMSNTADPAICRPKSCNSDEEGILMVEPLFLTGKFYARFLPGRFFRHT